jgi:hypothetical protein
MATIGKGGRWDRTRADATDPVKETPLPETATMSQADFSGYSDKPKVPPKPRPKGFAKGGSVRGFGAARIPKKSFGNSF